MTQPLKIKPVSRVRRVEAHCFLNTPIWYAALWQEVGLQSRNVCKQRYMAHRKVHLNQIPKAAPTLWAPFCILIICRCFTWSQRWNPIVILPKQSGPFPGSSEFQPTKPNKEKEGRNVMPSHFKMQGVFLSLSGITPQDWTFKRETKKSNSTPARNHHPKQEELRVIVGFFDIVIQSQACCLLSFRSYCLARSALLCLSWL